MKTVLLILYIFSFGITCSAQTYKYAFDADLGSTTFEKAVFIGNGIKEVNLVKVDFFHKITGARFMSAHFTDSTLSVMHGFFQSFYPNNSIETEGTYANGRELGIWIKKDSSGRLVDSSIFASGKRIVQAEYSYRNNGDTAIYSLTDSNAHTYFSVLKELTGDKYEVSLLNDTGRVKHFHSDGTITSRAANMKEKKEAEYPGGAKEFVSFLRRNLNANVPVDNNARPGIYQVIIKFVVNADGTFEDLSAETNFGYGMEAEALRTIRKMGKWIPASFFGIPVKAYRRQPITFVMSEQ